MDTFSAANRRKEERTAVDDNVYVVVNTKPEMMGQMVEISSTGMAFTFVDLNCVSQRLKGRQDLRIDFFAAGKGYFIRDLPARLVSAVDKSSTSSISSLMIKRIGLEFVAMSLSQQVQINSLIRRQNRQASVPMNVSQSA
jgi:c-di-GMP-binding flagellar brake protein YcgR